MSGEHMRAPFSDINPNCMVPVLEDGDFRLTESSAILKYLADKIGSPAYPQELKARARVNEMMDWLNVNFYRDWGYGFIYPQIFPHHRRESVASQVDTIEWGRKKSKVWLDLLDRHWLGRLINFEERLGNKLLLKSTRKIVLTEAGQEYLVRCEQIARDLEKATAPLEPATSESLRRRPFVHYDQAALNCLQRRCGSNPAVRRPTDRPTRSCGSTP
ncbi:MAG TPA: glutathione S-transferase N-terminal domain-containing protein [Roseiarcus sp.]|jgi:glutathione S-transferase|nr:glutathione S-transferase N-terminal domain-containing protein [Roseiarcus sp.]